MSELLSFDFERPAERKGRRGAGYNDFSWVKHGLAYKVVASQMSAYRVSHPNDRILLIDGNAGDGIGVPELKDQRDLFGPTFSRPTSQMMVELALADGNCDVILCEKDRKKRASLMHFFPEAIVLENHSEAVNYIRAHHRYAIWMSDPCGASGHGVKHMVAVALRVLCDFVVVFNEQFVMRRLAGVKKPNIGWDTSKERYGWMAYDQEWLRETGKSQLAKTVLFDGGPNFKYRVMVLANYLGRAARRYPFVEFVTIKREA
jgi:hypothetical protein